LIARDLKLFDINSDDAGVNLNENIGAFIKIAILLFRSTLYIKERFQFYEELNLN
jgi:hypothetical protein